MRPTGSRWFPGLALLAALVAPALAEDAVPRDGDDAVLMADGGLLRCRAGAEAAGRIELAFPSGTVRVPKSEVFEIRRFADFDPAPKSDEDRKKVADGQVRWGGQWVSPARRDDLLKKDRERQKKLWEEIGAHCQWESRWKRNTKHFTIEADIPRKSVDFYEEQLEGYYDYFTSALHVSPQRRIPVYVFRTREEFSAFQKKDIGRVTEHVVGYFTPVTGNEHLVLFDWQGNRAETVRVLLHECTHLLIYLANPSLRLPTWVNEGLAEYYGACQVTRGKVQRGGIQDGRLVDLRGMIEEKTLPDIDTLMAHGHPDIGAPGHKPFDPDDYAEGWAFVHFLFHGGGGKYLPRLLAYLNGHWAMKPQDPTVLSAGKYYWMKYQEDRDLLLHCLKFKDFPSMKKEFTDYVATLDFAGTAGKAEMGLRLLYERHDEAKAEACFREALAKCGDDPETLALLVKGYSMLKGKEVEAAAVLQKALESDPLNLPLRYDLSAWFPDGDEEIPHLRLCSEIAPGDPVGLAAVAWLAFRGAGKERWLADALTDPGDADRAAATLESGAPIPPADCMRMAVLLLRAGRPGPALEAARRAARSAPPQPAAFALLARAAAAAGDAEEFAIALAGFRTARQAAPPGDAPAGAAGLDLEASRVVVEAGSYALAAGKPEEARRVLDAWFARKGCGPRLEAEWILHMAVSAVTKDSKAFTARSRAALAAIPGSERIHACAMIARMLDAAAAGGKPFPPVDAPPDPPQGGDDGGDGGDDGN